MPMFNSYTRHTLTPPLHKRRTPTDFQISFENSFYADSALLLEELDWPVLLKFPHAQEHVGNGGFFHKLKVRDGTPLGFGVDLQFIQERCQVLEAPETFRFHSTSRAHVRREHSHDSAICRFTLFPQKKVPFFPAVHHIQDTEDAQHR